MGQRERSVVRFQIRHVNLGSWSKKRQMPGKIRHPAVLNSRMRRETPLSVRAVSQAMSSYCSENQPRL